MIRPAKPQDVAQIVELAVESVSKAGLPLRIDREGMAEMARTLISGGQHFAWVGEEDGKIVAAVGAQVHAGFWFERNQASVVMFYTRRAGVGAALLREFARWVKSRPTIKLSVFSLEHNADPRIGKLLHRLGFTMQNPQFVYCRGMGNV